MDVTGRMGRLRERLPDAGCDALLVTTLVNIRYLTGFTGSNGFLLVRPDDALFVTDGRYRDQSAEQLAAACVEAELAVILQPAELGDVLGRGARGVGRLGLEAESVTWALQRQWAGEGFAAREVVPDDRHAIEAALRGYCESGIRLVATTGGTGLGPRDVTPEATRAVAEALRQASS